MRSGSVAIAVIAGSVLLASPTLDACGDKFLRPGLMLRRAAHPASILVYMPPDSVVPAAAKELQLSQELKAAGHRIQTVVRAADLEAALASGSYDIVVGDASAGRLVDQTPAGSRKPRFLPILYKPTKQQLAAADKAYTHYLAAPARKYEALAEVDHVMEERQKAQKGTKAGL